MHAPSCRGINCTDCHGDKTASDKATPWQNKPGANACRECHESESDGFERGKHGMRLFCSVRVTAC
ncbi:MAG: cytochrome c3 family protein [Gammaproteobacteria bacterium]